MMIRYKWYRVRFPISFDEILLRLKSNRFSPDKARGFALHDLDPSGYTFRFLNRITVPTTTIYQEGNTRTELVQTIDVLTFKLFTAATSTFLRLENPGKSITPLLNELERLSGFGFYVEPVIHGANGTPPFLSKYDQVKLIGIKLTNVIAQEDVVGRIELASKEGIDISQLKILNGLKYTVDTATFEVLGDLHRGQLSFNKSGLVKVSEKIAQKFLAYYEEDLRNQDERKGGL